MPTETTTKETLTETKSVLGEVTFKNQEKRDHTGIYNLVSLGIGRKRGYVDCPFCNKVVECYLWSISGSGKKCRCGAIIYRQAAYRNLA